MSDGLVAADIGTDHGYIPIYLLESGKSPKAFAMDINEGPLKRATDHISMHDLSDRIKVRQSNGVMALKPGECEAVIVAGMGGALAIKIMEDGEAVFRSLKEFVLQPQSELEKVRLYLCEKGYSVVEEDMVLEDGKYYPMMKIVNQGNDEQTVAYTEAQLRYGKRLIEKNHPVLKSFLEKEIQTKREIVQKLHAENTLYRGNELYMGNKSHIAVRISELEKDILVAEKVLESYR